MIKFNKSINKLIQQKHVLSHPKEQLRPLHNSCGKPTLARSWDAPANNHWRHTEVITFLTPPVNYSKLMVGGWPTPLKNMSSSVGIIVPNIWKIENVPNHQPDIDVENPPCM